LNDKEDEVAISPYELTNGTKYNLLTDLGRVSLNRGEKIEFTAISFWSVDAKNGIYNSFLMPSGGWKVYGNIGKSITDAFRNNEPFEGEDGESLSLYGKLSFMFSGCTRLKSADGLILTDDLNPDNSCFAQMFTACTSLTDFPTMNFSKVSDSCFSYMFSYCLGLQKPARVNVTDLTNGGHSIKCSSTVQNFRKYTIPEFLRIMRSFLKLMALRNSERKMRR